MSPPTDPAPVSFQRLLSLAVPEWPTLALATISLLISSALQLAYPQAVRWMIDAITTAPDVKAFNTAAAVLIVVFIVQGVFSALRSWLFTLVGERIVTRLRSQLYGAILGKDLGFFDKGRTGELTNRLAADTTVLQNTVSVNVSMGLRFGAGAIGGVLMLLWMSPALTGIAMAVVPVVAITASLYGRLIRKLSRQVQDALAHSTEVAEETFSGVRTVRAFAREPQERARYDAAVEDSYLLAAKRALAVGVFSGVMQFAGFSTIALVVWWGGHLVVNGQMTMGELTAFLLYTMTVAMSMGALSSLYADFMKASGATQRVFQLIDLDAPLEGGGGAVVGSTQGAVRFDDVHFTYPSRPDVTVLDGLDLCLAPGEVVALVGPSGSGKSTIASLLLRFYDPEAGQILLDDRPYTSLAPTSLREQVGIVAQEPILFATSIVENIRYGRPGASDDDVRAAALTANALAFIEEFPDGFDTPVGERGVRLSGGQKQRIAIARAVLKDPRILILDEATSALDSESEHLVKEALERLMLGRTTLIIAHRLSTVRDADRVVVISQGRVAEQGTHDQLVQTAGLYHRLVERQFNGANEAATPVPAGQQPRSA